MVAVCMLRSMQQHVWQGIEMGRGDTVHVRSQELDQQRGADCAEVDEADGAAADLHAGLSINNYK